jgi:excisionase family DNA binding protein
MELSTAEVAGRMGLSQRQVQRLVSSKQLAATRQVGRANLVDATAVMRLGTQDRAPGRPWSAETAWAALRLLSGLEANWIDQQTSYRLRQRLKTMSPERLGWVCRSRAEVRRFRASLSFLDELRSRISLTGASALESGRDLLSPPTDSVDGYCTSADRNALIDEFFLVEDPVGNVTLRATDFERIASVKSQPAAVIGVDLLESADPRQRTAGRAILVGVLS